MWGGVCESMGDTEYGTSIYTFPNFDLFFVLLLKHGPKWQISNTGESHISYCLCIFTSEFFIFLFFGFGKIFSKLLWTHTKLILQQYTEHYDCCTKWTTFAK